MVQIVQEGTTYSKKHIMYNVLMSTKLYPANLWSRRCQISQLSKYADTDSSSFINICQKSKSL